MNYSEITYTCKSMVASNDTIKFSEYVRKAITKAINDADMVSKLSLLTHSQPVSYASAFRECLKTELDVLKSRQSSERDKTQRKLIKHKIWRIEGD